MNPKSPPRQPTQSDVAKKAGVSLATVSYALRNDPRIAAATQARVRAAAAALNYTPDPVLAALVARRGSRPARRTAANIAALVDDRWHATRQTHWHQSIIDGMNAACRRLGYALDILHIQRDLGPVKNPDRILHARGVRGIVLLPLFNHDIELRLQWSRYAVIAMGNPPASLPLHRVATDAFMAMQITCERLRELGYRRIGLANSLEAEQRLRFEWLGAIAKEMFLPDPHLKIVPPHLPKEFTPESLLAWVRRQKPEAVVTNNENIITWLRDAGLRVPDDIGVALLNLNLGPLADAAGISLQLDLNGETSIEQLHTLLLRGETGFPAMPKEVLLRPRWSDGFTLRALSKTARNKPSRAGD